MKTTEAQLRAIKKFDSNPNNVRRYALKLNMRNDADIISKLESVESKQGYIKQLIRADLNKQKEGKTMEKIMYTPAGTDKKGYLTSEDYKELLSRLDEETKELFITFFEKYHQTKPRLTVHDIHEQFDPKELEAFSAKLYEAKKKLNVSGKVFKGLMADVYYDHVENR